MPVKSLSDQELVLLVISDQEQYREVIRRYEKPLLRYATYLSNDPDLAADIVQQAFIKAFINLQSFNTDKKFSSWLYRITHNEAINLLKKNKFNSHIEDHFDLSSDIDVAEDLSKKELQSTTRECLEGVPAIYREVLSLYYLEELKYEEISDILRVPISTVGVRLKRAKLLMRKVCQTIKI